MTRTSPTAPRRTKGKASSSPNKKSKKHKRCGDRKHRVTVHVRKCTIRLPRRRPSKAEEEDGAVSRSRTIRWPGFVTVPSSRKLPKTAVAEQDVWFFPFAVDELVRVCSNAVIDAFRPGDDGGHKIRVPGAKIRRYHAPRSMCQNRFLRRAYQHAQQATTKKRISNRMLKRWGESFNGDDDDEDEDDEEEEDEEDEEEDEQMVDDDKAVEDSWDDDSDDDNNHCEESGSDVSLADVSVMDLWARHDLDERQQDRVITKIQKLLRSSKLPANKQAAGNVAKFFLFIHERQCAWMMRKQGKRLLVDDPKYPNGKPVYSNLPIFQEFRFCNNYRELDRGTQYFRSEMMRQWEKQGRPGLGTTKLQDQFKWMKTVLFASYLYRQINRMETFVEFGRGIPTTQQWPAFKKWAKPRALQRGKAFFTCAHQTIGWTALETNVNKLLVENHKKLKAITKALVVAASKGVEACFGVFHQKRVQGCGAFFSWQILSDLLECKCLGHGCNDQQWTKLGPGARQGMNDIFEGQSSERHLTMAMELTRLQPRIYEEVLQLDFCKFRGDYLSLKNMEHALCEYSKFVRIEAKLNTGENCKTRKWRPTIIAKVNKCFGCERNDKKCMSCDTCSNAYCRSCDKSWSGNQEVSWICRRCNAFESLTFDN